MAMNPQEKATVARQAEFTIPGDGMVSRDVLENRAQPRPKATLSSPIRPVDPPRAQGQLGKLSDDQINALTRVAGENGVTIVGNNAIALCGTVFAPPCGRLRLEKTGNDAGVALSGIIECNDCVRPNNT